MSRVRHALRLRRGLLLLCGALLAADVACSAIRNVHDFDFGGVNFDSCWSRFDMLDRGDGVLEPNYFFIRPEVVKSSKLPTAHEGCFVRLRQVELPDGTLVWDDLYFTLDGEQFEEYRGIFAFVGVQETFLLRHDPGDEADRTDDTMTIEVPPGSPIVIPGPFAFPGCCDAIGRGDDQECLDLFLGPTCGDLLIRIAELKGGF